MKYFTKIFSVVALCLFGVLGTQAKVEQVHATFASPSNTNTTWTPDASGVTKGTFTWSTTYYNQLRNIGLPTGDITGYKKLVVDCEIKSGNQFRILIYKGGSNLTLYASDGLNEFILADTLKALYPDTYNEFLLDCTEICLSGNNQAAPGEAVIKDVYLETYNDEGEKVFATFESPNNTNTTWTPDTSGETAGTFTWSTTYYNQLRNIGLPSGDISGYKKLVVDTEIKSGNQFRILIYKGGSNLTLYASNGLNEFILADTLKALYPDTYNEFLLDCTEICLSGNNNAAPGEAVIKSVYLETYPENEVVDIPEIVYEEDPGVPEGDFVDFTEAFPEVQARIGLGTDGHPIVLGNGDVVLGQRSKNVVADLSAYSKFTMVTSPNLKLVLYMNHEVDAQQNAGDYSEADAGKYVFMDVQADENGLIEVDLTQFTKQDLNCIALPWDNNNKGTVWHLLLTAAGEVDPLAADKKALEEAIAAAKMRTALGKTEESFATLTDAIADAEAALVAEEATAETLATAKQNVEAAIEGLTLAEGYTKLTSEMYFNWSDPENPVALDLATVLFASTGQPYGDPQVKYFNYADLTGYDKLVIGVAEGTPRIMLNRAEPLEEGVEGYDPNGGAYIQITDAPVEGVVEVDLTQYDFAHLNAIKGANWSNVTVTDLLLYKAPVVATHTWDFTQWSEATVANLKAEAAKVTVEADLEKEGNTMCVDNGALWSDHEKKPGTSCDTYAASKDNCFWYMGGEAEPTANGEAVAEFAGLEFNTTYGASRALAIAVNYPSTSLGTYNGPAYLWFGGKNQTILTIKNVKPGTTITMGVESHKSSDARGVKLFLDDNELTDPEGAAVSAPKTYTEQTWQVPVVDSEVVNIVVKNTNGCHIYFIDAEIGESGTTGINTVETSTVANDAIYNLAGQRVAQPAKGLFIINGKKVVIK